MNYSKLIVSILFTLFLIGCNSSDEKKVINVPVTDQKIPGTNIDSSAAVRGVFNIAICPTAEPNPGYSCPEETLDDEGQVTLTWTIPALYRTEDWFVTIYRANITEDNSALSLGLTTDPRSNRSYPQIGNVIYEQVRLKDTTYVDETTITGARYYYWIFLTLAGKSDVRGDTEGFWSTATRTTVSTTSAGSSVEFPSAADFWKKVQWNNLVSAPAGSGSNPVFDRSRMKAGTPSLANPKGRMALANNGSILFASDTNNNRVIVFENSTALTCLDEFADDDLSYFACLLQAESMPPSALNVLGQPDEKATLSCQEHNSVCSNYTSYCSNVTTTCASSNSEATCNAATVPGANGSRVCGWTTFNTCIPLSASCSNESQCLGNHVLTNMSDATPSFCKWEGNSCKVKGESCLTKPTDLFVTEDNQLVIADSGNNRVLLHNSSRFTGASNVKYTIGCDNDVLITQIRPTKCDADKLFGKPNFNDFASYNVAMAGSSSLNNPTGVSIYNDDLYIADTGNNRVVKAYSYESPDQYLCNDDTWLTALCQWRGLLGQADYLSNKTFKDFIAQEPNLLGGIFNNELQSSVLPPTLPNTLPLWYGESQDVLTRYFRNPSKIKFIERDNKTYMLVLAHEDLNATTGIGTQISLRNRILRFDNLPINNATPVCNSSTFDTSVCQANDVIGQENFKKLIILSGTSGGSGAYTSSVFALDNIDDLETLGPARLLAVSAASNELYSWNDFLTKEANGYPYNIKVIDPAGAVLSSATILPDLQGISSVVYDVFNGKCFVNDSVGSKLFQLNFVNNDF